MPTRTFVILLVACLGVALALPKVVLKADNGKTTAITWDGAELHVPQHCDQRCIDHFSNKIANVEKMLTEVIKRVDALDHSHTDIKKISESTHQKLEHYHPPTQYPTPAPTPHPCDDGTHACSKAAGGICYKSEQDMHGFTCGCAKGWVETIPHSPPYVSHKCVKTTPSPTPVPPTPNIR